MNHPVGGVIGGGHASHRGHPGALIVSVLALVQQPQPAAAGKLFKDGGGAIARAVISHQDQVNAVREVKSQGAGDDVCLITAEEGHHHPHRLATG